MLIIHISNLFCYYIIIIIHFETFLDDFTSYIYRKIQICSSSMLTLVYISKSIHSLRMYPAREICRVRENRVVDRIARRKIGMNGTKNVVGHAWRIVGVLRTVETQREREGRGNERNESSTTHNPGRVSSLKKQIDKQARLIKGDNRRS